MDEVDRPIIAQLRADSRAAKRRVDHSVEDGIITALTIVVDTFGQTRPTEAYVEVFCRGTVPPDELLKIISGLPEVVRAGTETSIVLTPLTAAKACAGCLMNVARSTARNTGFTWQA